MHLKGRSVVYETGNAGGTRQLLTLYVQSGHEAPGHTVHAVRAREEVNVGAQLRFSFHTFLYPACGIVPSASQIQLNQSRHFFPGLPRDLSPRSF